MSDIVERLRELHADYETFADTEMVDAFAEAADEIERLRSIVQSISDYLTDEAPPTPPLTPERRVAATYNNDIRELLDAR